MKKLISIILLSIFYFSGCQSIKYSDDIGFMSSAEAGYENLPAFINKKPCLDMDGIIGRCSKAIASDKPLLIQLPVRPYSYNYSVSLTSGVGCVDVKINDVTQQMCPPIKFDVPEKAQVDITIPITSYIPLFMIVGRIAPDDRPEPISALFRALITVYDSGYSQREQIFEYEKYIVMGEHAHFTDIIFENGIVSYKNKPAINLKGRKYQIAMSESYNMRFNFELK
jgi:hypothetical protein